MTLQRCLVFLLTTAIIGSPALFAGSAGKIAGNVKDKNTGEPLIGTNIILEGTNLGGSTDINGHYTILNVPPGTYTVIASMVGYTTSKTTGVRVNIDLTTTIDIELSETVVELGQEVVVVADRPLVQRDLTAKTAIVGGEQIDALPVTEVGSVLALQAGFVAGSLRGGRSGEVAYWIDGVPVTDSYNGSQIVEVNKSLVQELQLVSGAFNAEYGQAMSGIVNIATKEGGRRFKGGIGLYGGDYLTGDKDLFKGLSFNPTNIRNVEGNLSGPVFGEDLTFFANARYIYFNGYLTGVRRFNPENISYTDSAGTFQLYRDPSGKGDSSVVPMNWSNRSYGQGKLSWRIAPQLKLTGNYIFDRSVAKAYDRGFYFNPDGKGRNFTTSHTAIFQFTHTLNANSFYTIGGSGFYKVLEYYVYEDPHDPRYVHPKLLLSYDSYSALTGGVDLGRFRRSTTTYLVKFDYTNQMDATNLVKLGAEVRKNKILYNAYSLQPIASQTDIDLNTASPFIQTQIPPVSSNLNDYYRRRPTEFSFYAQDKMEFKDIIVNIGVRFDHFEPDGVILADPSDPSIYNPIKPGNIFFDTNGDGIQDPGENTKTVADRRSYWYKKASAKSGISPRLGVSFPVTERGIVHFSYGHFFQIPRFERLYENPDFKIGLGTGNQGVIGNSDLNLEQTISGELGVQQQLTEDIAVDVTAYMRDIRNLTGTQGEEIIVFGGASKYSKYTNSDFGFVRGVVLTLNKKFSGGLNATVDYTFQVARGSASDPQQARNALAGGELPEVQLTPLGWDQRHTLNVTASYSSASWGVSMIGQYGSGTPYTPRSSTDISTILTNSQLKPEFLNVDLRAFHTFSIDVVKVVAFARIFNLFDIRNEIIVYNDTGRAGFTSDEALVLATRPAQYVNTIRDYFNDPTFYSEPRRIEFGVNLEF